MKMGLFLLIGGILWMAVNLPFSLETTPDSRFYMVAAINLRAGVGFMGPVGVPFVAWPPLYPLILSLFPNPLSGAWITHLLSFGVTLACSWILLRHFIGPRWLCVAGLLIIFRSPALAFVYGFVWSEPLFIALVLVGAVCALKLETRGQIALFSFVTLLTVMQRYGGVALVAAGSLILLWNHRHDWRKAFLSATAYALPSVALLSLWLAHNALLTGHPTGDRSNPGIYTLAGGLADALITVLQWIPSGFKITLLIGALYAFVILVRLVLRGPRPRHRHKLVYRSH